MRQKGFALIIIILVIGILALASYFFVMNKSTGSTMFTPLPVQESTLPIPTSQPRVLPTISTTKKVVTGEVIILSMDVDTMTVQFIAESQMGNITEMMVWTDSNSTKQWQKFSTLLDIPVSEDVYVKYRDNLNNESEVYTDTTISKQSPPQQ